MKETIESIRRQFEALIAKIDPTSPEMLRDRDYTTQLADCVARTYVMLNNGMCEVLDVCYTCADERDFLRHAMERFETIGEIDKSVEQFYFEFIERIGFVRRNIEAVLARL